MLDIILFDQNNQIKYNQVIKITLFLFLLILFSLGLVPKLNKS